MGNWCFWSVFGDCDNIFPRVQTPDVPVGAEDGGDGSISVPVPFEQRTVSIHVRAVNFGSFKTKRYGNGYQRALLYQRWEAILLHAPDSSTAGQHLATLARTIRLSKIETIFSGKATSTLRKTGRGNMFPLTIADLREYFEHLHYQNAARTVFTEWLPCTAFLQHVVGMQLEEGYFSDPFCSRSTSWFESSSRPSQAVETIYSS